MNNNKKYKKWSLGLVAPALVLAPIAVVASCSSSGEEKPVYSVSFKQPTLSVEVNNKNVKPSKLSKEGFVQEIINNKTNIFNIDDSSGKVTDDFLRENLVVGDITAKDDEKTASAEVTLNNKNTDGGSESTTITLTGFDYQEADLENLIYTIKFKDSTTPQEINLEGKSEVSVTSLDKSSLVKLVLEEKTKEQILTIEGTDAEKITNDVLENQILEVTDTPIESDKVAGTIKFELKVLNDGTKNKAEIKKEIKFSGFKTETDSTPATEYQIALQDKDTEGKYTLTTVASQTTEDFPDANSIKELIIKEKSIIFKATKGELPTDKNWWDTNLQITKQPSSDSTKGEITVTIQLSNSNSSDDSQKINEEIILKGFQQKPATPTTGNPTEITSEVISSVTVALNGNFDEIKASNEINEKWVFDHKHLFFTQGDELITDETAISDVIITGVNPTPYVKMSLSFKVAEGKWYDQNGDLNKTNKREFSVAIDGLSSGPTNKKTLGAKFGSTTAWAITKIEPRLAKMTKQQAKELLEKKQFIFKYMKNFLTGDFRFITESDTIDTFFKGDVTVTEEAGDVLKVDFQIKEEKTVKDGTEEKNPAAVSISFKLNGFATN